MKTLLIGSILFSALVPARADDFWFKDKLVPMREAKSMPDDVPYKADDPRLAVGDSGVTVDDLADWARKGDVAQLERLFKEYAVVMECLPRGLSAGTAGGINLGALPSAWAGSIAASLWHGKAFADGTCAESKGKNRINQGRSIDFVTRVVSPTGLAPTRANMVELNYAAPGWHPLAHVVKLLGVYDLMAAIPGKYGPIYVGKTWLGKYQDGSNAGSFSTAQPEKLTAWFFLDFNVIPVQLQGARLQAEQDELYARTGSDSGGLRMAPTPPIDCTDEFILRRRVPECGPYNN